MSKISQKLHLYMPQANNNPTRRVHTLELRPPSPYNPTNIRGVSVEGTSVIPLSSPCSSPGRIGYSLTARVVPSPVDTLPYRTVSAAVVAGLGLQGSYHRAVSGGVSEARPLTPGELWGPGGAICLVADTRLVGVVNVVLVHEVVYV